MSDTAQRFLDRFGGYEHAHINYAAGDFIPDAKGKLKPKYSTISAAVSLSDVEAHLSGVTSVGVSPLLASNRCRWGVVDVDVYGMDEKTFQGLVRRLSGQRVAVHRSKSSGAHVYLFASEEVPAADMRGALAWLQRKVNFKKQGQVEIFPAKDRVEAGSLPKAVNLPYFGNLRPCSALIVGDDKAQFLDASHTAEQYLQAVEKHLLHTPNEIARLASLEANAARSQPVRDLEVGFREPDNAAGRQDHLYRTGCSMRARGGSEQEIADVLRDMNAKYAVAGHPLWETGELPEPELAEAIKNACKRPAGERASVHYDRIREFNERFAIMQVNGKVEVIDLSKDEFITFGWNDFVKWTATDRVRTKSGSMPLAHAWLADVDRAQFDGVVLEREYDGPAYNLWPGYGIEPAKGDVSVFKAYLLNDLAGGDQRLADWIEQWLADGVQRPTEPSVPTALLLRGPQGQGKTLLLRFLQSIMPRSCAEVADAGNRLFAKFNRQLMGRTFIGAEEAIFVGDPRTAQLLKTFISSPRWSYEEKYGATIEAKNVHRLIATTNQDHGALIENDDRRFTIVEVAKRFDLESRDGRKAAYNHFGPHYAFLETGRAALLHHLLNEVKVDREFISFACPTAAKQADKAESDALLRAMIEWGEDGKLHGDYNGKGAISNQDVMDQLADLSRGTKRASVSAPTKESLFKHVCKKVPLAEKTRAACHWKFQGFDIDGQARYLREANVRGIQFPPLTEYRAALEKIVGPRDWGPVDEWRPWGFATCGKRQIGADEPDDFAPPF